MNDAEAQARLRYLQLKKKRAEAMAAEEPPEQIPVELEQKSTGQKVLESLPVRGLLKGLSALESVTASPLRSGTRAVVQGELAAQDDFKESPISTALKTPLRAGGNFAKGLIEGFGKEGTPGTEATLGDLGVPEGKFRTAAGFAGDLVQDPTMWVGPGLLRQSAVTGGKALARTAGALKTKAGKLAETATGATRVQAEKFAPKAGEKLLDEGIVRFGSSPGGIAKRAETALEKAGQGIDEVITGIGEKGALSLDDFADGVRKKFAELKKEGAAGVRAANEAESWLLDTLEAAKAEGKSTLSVADIEKYKRNVGPKAWKSISEETLPGAKAAYRGMRDLSENVVGELDPKALEAFQKEKKAFEMLSPIFDASAKRARQLNQHPWLGLLDTSAAGTGALGAGLGALQGDGDPEKILLGGALGLLGRRVVAPRIASTAAVSTNAAGKGVGLLSKALGSAEKIPPGAARFLEAIAKRAAAEDGRERRR